MPTLLKLKIKPNFDYEYLKKYLLKEVAKNSKNTYKVKDILENLVKVCSVPSIKIKTSI